jgi:hypothetical protein
MTSNNNNNIRKVSEEFVIKVFDKVRDVNEELADDVKELRNAVIGLVEAYNKQYEGQPQPKELHILLDNWGKTFEIRHAASKEKLEYLEVIIATSKEMLKDHCDHAEAGISNIEEAIERDDSKLDKIIDGIGNVKKRTNTMIIVVAVAFSLMTITYLFVRGSIDTIIETKIEKIETQHQEDIDKKLDNLERLIKQHMKEGK